MKDGLSLSIFDLKNLESGQKQFYTKHVISKNEEVKKQITRTETAVNEKLDDIEDMIEAIEDLTDDWDMMKN